MADSTLGSARPQFTADINRLFPVWTANAVALNIGSEQNEVLSGSLAAYNAALDANANAVEAAKQASRNLRDAEAAARRGGNSALRTIRGTAEVATDPASVYNTAQIAPPAPSAPLPAPAAPAEVTATLQSDGTTKVNWTSAGARSVYALERLLFTADGSAGVWRPLRTATTREYVDASIPVGTTAAQYRVQATRAQKTGPWSQAANLAFVPASAESTAELKIAA